MPVLGRVYNTGVSNHMACTRLQPQERSKAGSAQRLDIDQAMEALLHEAGEDFRKKVQLWGAVHADPCRWALCVKPQRGTKGICVNLN